MSFARGALSDTQRRKIEENRRKALERLQKKGLREGTVLTPVDASIAVTAKDTTLIVEHSPKKPRIELTPEQKKRIEENRKKALAIRERLLQQNRDASEHKQEIIPVPKAIEKQEETRKKTEELKPMNKKRDYIDYDFSTMKDTHGGFMDDPPDIDESENKALEEWKEKQKREHIVRDLAPPVDISQAPKCYECGSLEIDPNLYQNFRNVRVCRRCAKAKPEKYSLLTKTECKEDYLLTEPELQDLNLLPRIEKPNPHGFSRMQLFLRFQVEEFATKKWGSLDNLDKEWEKREEMRLKRKDKKYNDKLKQMRKKTRAEEFTRKLRNGVSINEKHTHDWSEPTPFMKDDMKFNKRRCVDCGIEIEELQF